MLVIVTPPETDDVPEQYEDSGTEVEGEALEPPSFFAQEAVNNNREQRIEFLKPIPAFRLVGPWA